MKLDNQLRHGVRIVNSYNGEIPLPNWLKNYFRDNPQMGSRDRKQLSDMVYSYYRLGHSLRSLAVEERMLAGLFLCHQSPLELLNYFKPSWNETINLPAPEKYSVIDSRESAASIFPWHESLSDGIDPIPFSVSHLNQPDLFLRVRPGHQESVIKKIGMAAWDYEWIPPAAVRLPNSTKADQVLALNQEAVIQDLSSQLTGTLMQEILQRASLDGSIVWDCCAGSGGKSLLFHDLFPGARLLVSDLRPSILLNLNKRFQEAGIGNYEIREGDLRKKTFHISGSLVDVILADVPCSGSGTWGRNPERLYFYRRDETGKHQRIQQQIISNAVPQLRKGGYFIYITCSVFKEENEEMVQFIQERQGLELIQKRLFKGYDLRADTMFGAAFRN